MTINGQVYSSTYSTETARGGAHAPVIRAGKIKADQGILPLGLLLTKDPVEGLIPLEEVAAESVGVGDGATKAYTHTLAAVPVEPGSVAITDGTETFSDDGKGHLTGDAVTPGTGTVNYKTGAVSIQFSANVADQAAITANYVTEISGVLDERVDTSKSTSALRIVHGSVRGDKLKVGDASSTATPATATLKLMEVRQIWPE